MADRASESHSGPQVPDDTRPVNARGGGDAAPPRAHELGLGAGAEFDLIRHFHSGAEAVSPEGVAVGAGDDCCVVTGEGIALSTDMSVEGVHFRRDWWGAREIGYRAAAAALSDLAAVAARPIGVLASLAVPREDAGDFAVEVMWGVRSAAEALGGVLLGGDTTRTDGPVVLDVTVVGEARRPVLRSGALPGDELWVTGLLGAPACALGLLAAGDPVHPDLLARLVAPVPRTREALWLAERGLARAMLDVSDGVAGDAGHLARASGVRVILSRASLPVHPRVAETSSAEAAWEVAASGGEEFELLFAARAGTVEPVREEFAARWGIPLTRIGRIEAGEGVFWETPAGRVPVQRGGYDHFEDG